MLQIFFLTILAISGEALAHSGGLNSQGCHSGSQPYHCHRSPSEMVPSSSGGYRLKCSAESRSKDCESSVQSAERSEKPKTPPPRRGGSNVKSQTALIGSLPVRELLTCYTHAAAFVEVYAKTQLNNGVSFEELKEDKLRSKTSGFAGVFLGYVAILDKWDTSSLESFSASVDLSPLSEAMNIIKTLAETKGAGDLSQVALGAECSILSKTLLKDLDKRNISDEDILKKVKEIGTVTGLTLD